MTQRDKWAKRPAVLKYRAFKDEIRARKIVVSEKCHVVFIMPMPKSWSKAKKARLNGSPHCQRPDLDNLLKALWDASLDEDSHIWSVNASKIWGEQGAITILG